jgi:hypothetical protein
MASMTGRIVRVVVGAALLVLGLFVVKDVLGYVIAAVALVPLLAGLFDFCVISKLFGGPFRGEDIRARV